MTDVLKHFLGPIPLSVAGVDAVLAELSWTIDSLVKRRDVLKRYRERLTRPPPVYSLPDDVLIRVFQICIESPFEWFPRGLYNRFPYFRFFSFSGVCRSWRQLALSTPLLWEDPILSHSEIASIMLQRAKEVPLRVHIILGPSDYRSKQAAIDAVLQRTPQISDLAISGTQGSSTDILGTLYSLNQMGPVRLRTLNIDISSGSTVSLGSSQVDQLTSLSTLSLVWCSAPLTSPALVRLTQIRLSGEYTLAEVHYPLASLMQALARLPLLADVRLDFCIRSSPLPSSLKTPVCLPSLKNLRIRDDLRICLSVLKSIGACPSLLNMSVGDDMDHMGDSPRFEVMQALFPQLRRLYALSTTSPRSFASLEVSGGARRDAPLRIYGSWSQSSGEWAGFNNEGLSFWMELPTFEETTMAVDLSATVLPVNRVSCLMASNGQAFSNRHLSALSTLTHIHVADIASMQFISNWCSPEIAQGMPVTRFLALEYVSFETCDFLLPRDMTYLGLPPSTDTRSELQALIDTVRQCSMDGRPLKQLTFQNCFFESADDTLCGHPILDEGFIRRCLERYVTVLVFKGGFRSTPLT
jgi:hypothetical protein